MRDFRGFDNPLGRALSHAYRGLRHVDQIRKQLKPGIRPDVPTISVGNITVGGTGKTPMIVYLADLFTARGKTPVVLSRGYLGSEPGPVRATPDQPERFGDEATMLARRGIAVWVAKRRELAVPIAQQNADVLLLDDGFQRIEIERDLDLVMFHADGLGNGRMLPAGTLRDDPRNLDRADGFCGPRNGLPVLFPEIPRFEFHYNAPRLQPQPAAQERVAALAAIAHPQRFFQTLRSLPIQLVHTFPLRDHDPLSPARVRDIRHICKHKGIHTLVVTEKDAAKCQGRFGDLNICVAYADFGPIDDHTAHAFRQLVRARTGL